MSDIKRLLCIVSAMNTGGAETFLMKLYRKLDKTKYQMDFCVNDLRKGFYDDEIKSLGGKMYVIPCKSNGLKAFKRGLSDVIKNNNYKYVMRITSNAMGFYDLKIAKRCGASRCIVRSSNSSDGSGWKIKAVHLLGKFLFRRYVDVKIAPSDLAAKYTFGKKEYENGKVTILHNAIDLNQYCFSMSERKRIRKEFNIAEDALVIGHVGRFSIQKNHEFLIDIFTDIHTLDKNAVLLLVGTGELLEQVRYKVEKNLLQDKVIFCGVRKDIPQLLSAMDVFLFPSFYEGMPNTVIEAQATGLPCIISDTITREANITGLIKYNSLNDSSKVWAKDAIKAASKLRVNTKDKYMQVGYDIENVVKEFEKIIFEY